jgi:hypothetical protein
MKFQRRKVLGAEACTALLFFIVLLAVGLRFASSSIYFGRAQLTTSEGIQAELDSPYILAADSGQQLKFVFHVYRPEAASAYIRIYPDDCLESLQINGHPVSLAPYSKSVCDFPNGFVINLENELPVGSSVLEAVVFNRGGPAALRIAGVRHWHGASWNILAVVAALSLLLVAVLRAQSFDWGVTAVILAAWLLRLLYFSVTPPQTRTYDVFEYGGHVDYIRYLLEHWALPIRSGGWEFHQPPLYYLFAALCVSLTRIDNTLFYLSFLQLLSLFFSLAGLYFVCILFSEIFSSLWIRWTACALACFWPSGIIASVRIGNDAAVCTLMTVALLYLWRWWREDRDDWLCWSAVWTGLGVLVKYNALTSMALIAVLFLFRRTPWRAPRQATLGAGIILFFLVCLLLCGARRPTLPDSSADVNRLSGLLETSVNPVLLVDSSPYRFLTFDYRTFLTQPFINPRDDKTGRQYFWNYFLKSCLFGEFRLRGAYIVPLATSASFLLLLFVGLALFRAVSQSSQKLYLRMPFLLNAILLMAALFYFRFRLPYACTADFRYVYPLLFTWIVLWGDSAEQSVERHRTALAYMHLAIACGLIVCSIGTVLSLAGI